MHTVCIVLRDVLCLANGWHPYQHCQCSLALLDSMLAELFCFARNLAHNIKNWLQDSIDHQPHAHVNNRADSLQ